MGDSVCLACCQSFDLQCRRPKLTPCEHVACSSCLQQRRCPTCQLDFPNEPSGLPDCFAIVESLVNASNDRPLRSLWCIECQAVASADCEDTHTLWGMRRAIRHYAAQMQELPTGATEDLRAACARAQQLLEQHYSDDKAQAALQLLVAPVECNVTLRSSAASFTASWSLAEGPASNQHSLEDKMARMLALSLLSTGKLQPFEDFGTGDTVTSSEEEPLRRSCRREISSSHMSMDTTGLDVKPDVGALAAALDSPPVTPNTVSSELSLEQLDLYDLSICSPGFNVQAKQDMLQSISNRTIGSITRLHCDEDPGWSLQILQRVQPQFLEGLDIRYVQWDHLAAAHAAVASLRRMSVSGTPALANSDGELTLPELSSVEVLEVSCFPRRALLTLIRAHRLKLRELRLCVGTGGCVDSITYSGGDLSSLLAECGLRAVQLVVLLRESCLHVAARCRAQRAQLRAVLPKEARVLCGRCDLKQCASTTTLLS